MSGLTVVGRGKRTCGGNVVTLVSDRTPGGSGPEGQTVSAVIVGSAAAGDGDAGLLSLTPGLSGIASALKSLTVVVGRAISGDVITSVGKRTPGGSRPEGQAASAVVPGGAARGNNNTAL